MSKIDKDIFKVLAPKVMTRALAAFDRATMVVVASCWAAALAVMLLSIYSLVIVGDIKKDVAAAGAMEPNLPRIVKGSLSRNEMDTIMDRLKKRFPDLGFSIGVGQTLIISAVDGDRFRLWLTALSYTDTIFPQYRWSIREFCVGGQCGARETPMKATLSVEKISFSIKEN